MHKELPEFLGIGTQKGGTTTLHQLLTSHPQVFLPKCKEIHFFSLHYAKGTNWYANHFKDAAKDQIKGEITPLYLFDTKAPKRIHKILPEAKLITLLRDPVERTLSQIFHARRRGFETLEPKDAIDADDAARATSVLAGQTVRRATSALHRGQGFPGGRGEGEGQEQRWRWRRRWP